MITCTFENGGTGSLRHVTVDALLLNENNQILLVKRAPHLTNGGLFALIGGFVDRDETLEEAVIREIIEETGYEATVEKLLRIIDAPQRPKEDRQNISFTYIARVGKKVGESDKESTEMRWFELNALPDKDQFAFDHLESIEFYKKSR